MSDFDKEAERERLREKYEEEEEEREATQRMSQLLLQGATMTNQHCEVCGDPIFRQEGREFCPTCQEDREDGTPAGDDGAPADRQPGADDRGADADVDAGDSQTVQPQQSQPQQPQQSQPQQPQQSQPQDRQPTGGQPQSGTAGATADLSEARQSLARTLTVAARHAENAEDPQTATAYLEAAREAAEALAALRGQ
jgi:uncharacterized Zn finger protein (UPF0148 family)